MSVVYEKGTGRFFLTTGRTAYAMGIDPTGNLQHLYWGPRLPVPGDYPAVQEVGQTVGIGKNGENPRHLSEHNFFYPYEAGQAVIEEEYVGWGGLNFVEPCLKLVFPDGVRDLRLKTYAHRLEADGDLVVTLKDTDYPLFVHLRYRVLEDVDLIVRRADIENRCSTSVWLESAQSAVWHVPPGVPPGGPGGGEYRLSQLVGRWGNEFNLERVTLPQGKLVMESRRGITSHHQTPWFALDPGGASGEHDGPVWFGALAWSGNWKMVVERTSNQQVRVTGGINDFDFAWEIKPGETFQTPDFIGGYTGSGFGECSRLLHRYGLHTVYPEATRGRPWPVFYNTWETFWFDFDEAKLMALAEKAAALGVEVFHVDDGWFGTRQNEYSGLGDWTVNWTKFPRGLQPLVDKVSALGMTFSLWIEPENVNVDSDLYRAHPDWVYRFPTRKPTIQRESLILNLGKQEVREHLWGRLSDLVQEHHVRHFKWDLNRHMSEPGWCSLPAQKQKEVWVRHVHGLYELLDRLKSAFPEVTLECCSGGGGRVDYGILKRCEIGLASDNHDPLARLQIQEGYTTVYPAKTMGCWVTDTPSPLTNRSLPLKFMFHAAMLGALGIQTNLLQWGEAEMELARRMIRLYKEIRPVIQEGDLYRLASLREGHLMASQYLAPGADRAVIFAFMKTHPACPAPRTNILRWGSPRFLFRVFPQGLTPGRCYRVDGESSPRSGESILRTGIQIEMEGDDDSQILQIHAVPG